MNFFSNNEVRNKLNKMPQKSKRRDHTLRIESLEQRHMLAATPIGYWSFDNAANLGEDSSGNGNNLTSIGGPTQEAVGVNGGALSLNGAGQYLGGITPVGLPTGNSTYAIAAWFKTSTNSQEGIVGWGNYGSTNQVTALRTNGNGFAHYWWGGGFDLVVGTGGPNILDNQWHHIVANNNGTTRSLYLDGNLIGQDNPPVHNAGSANFAVGRTCTTCSGGEFFAGSLDDVAIWDEAISLADIQNLASGATPIGVPPTADNDAYSVNEDTTLVVDAQIGVLDGDVSPQSLSLTANIETDVSNGDLTLNSNGSFTYIPDTDFNGIDTFTYKANDGQDSNIATVTITVNPQSDSVVAIADTFAIDPSDDPFTAVAPGVLANDDNPDSLPLTALLVRNTPGDAVILDTNGSFTYDHTGVTGTETFEYKVNDGTDDSNTVIVTLIIDNAPVADNDSYNTTEDQSLNINNLLGVLDGDTDNELDSLTAVLISDVTNGSLTLNTNGSFDYTPNLNFNGSDSFTYVANDGDQDSNIATVTINVAAENDAPVANIESYDVIINQPKVVPVAIGVLDNDTDVDNDTLMAVEVSGPSNGSLVLNSNGSFTYTPNPGYTGPDSFQYKANDTTVDSNTVTVSLTIAPLVAPPIGYWSFDNAADLGEDNSGNGNDLTAFSSPTQDASGVNGGALSLTGAGQYLGGINPTGLPIGNSTYTIAAWIKPDVFADDGIVGWGNYGAATQVNALRTFGDGFRHYWWAADLDANAGQISTLGTGSLLDGNWHHITAVYDGTTRALYWDGALLVSDTPGANGSTNQNFAIGRTCTFCAGGEFFDGLLDDVAIWDEALDVANIEALANGSTPLFADPPIAVDDPDYSVDEDNTLNVNAVLGVLNNDTSIESLPLFASLISDVSNGMLTLNTDGSFEYIPDAEFSGSDSFTYIANDGLDSNIATVTITINSVADPVVAVADLYVVNPTDNPFSVDALSGVLNNDSNPDLLPLTVNLVVDSTSGTLNLSNDGSFTYLPTAFIGDETFTYNIFDDNVFSNTVTVILRVDTPPVADNDSYNLNEGQTLNIDTLSGVLDGDTDAELDFLTAVLVSTTTNGTLTLNSNGSFEYIPNPNFSGIDSFTYTANDGDQDSPLATVTLNVAAVNDPPVATLDAYFGFQDQTLNISAPGVLGNDTDVDGPSLSAVLVSTTSSGSLTFNNDGSFMYEPNPGFLGQDTFQYKANDTLVDSNTVTVTLTMNSLDQQIVINEINYDSPDNTQPTEFIELYNAGTTPVDLTSWAFTDGVDFTFPATTILQPDSYLIVAEDPATMFNVYGVNALGPWVGQLSNDGEDIDLRNALGDLVDTVDYGVAFPWPTATLSGSSMELIHPSLDNDLGGSWRSSSAGTNLPENPITLLSLADTTWSYRKGTSEASDPVDDWRQAGFDDSAWIHGAQTPIGYGDGDDNTVLGDMQNSYTTVYLRNTFDVGETVPSQINLRVYVDDGAIVYINGVEVARLFVSAGEKAFDAVTGEPDHEASLETIEILNAETLLNSGINTIAIHSINVVIGSTDLSIDAEVIIPGQNSSAGVPTPGELNSVFATNAPPQARQAKHSPQSPTTADPTTITLKVTDPDGVETVDLEYQIVLPGAYIPAFLPVPLTTLQANPDTQPTPNPAYSANWITVSMVDDGTNGDAVAGDDIYTAVVPAQTANRTLVRYRMTVEDTFGNSVTVPYADDPSLNFAYYVYDGVPEYNGHTVETLESLPVYSIVTRNEDWDEAIAWNPADQLPQFNDSRFVYNWHGTMVFDGIVYDNIKYRPRGANGRYLGGSSKRSMRFRFNDGNFFAARDQDGNLYPEKQRTLTTAKGFDNRLTLTYALNEQINFYLFNELGVSAPTTNYFHFRVVDGVEEAPAGANGLYDGDFWGINFAQETYDIRFLKSHDLEKGNLYKLINSKSSGIDQQRYQAQDAVTGGLDHDNIENNLDGNDSAAYIEAHVNLEEWNVYHALNQAIRDYDYWPSANKNAVYYFEPDYLPENNNLGKLNILPWDTDATWGPTFNSGFDVVYNSLFNTQTGGNGTGGDSGSTPELWPGYFAAIREIRDLLWQPDQIEPLIDHFADKIAPFIEADRDRWIGGPASSGNYDGIGGVGKTSFADYIQDMKNFAFTGGSWPGGGVGAGGRAAFLDTLQASNGEGAAIPDTPTITYTGGSTFPGDLPTDDLQFETTAFNDPQGAGTFAAIQWRIATWTDINDPSYDPSQPFKLEYVADWESGELTTFNNSVSIPVGSVEVGSTYRARVRMQDTDGRWSHWSDPVEFTTTISTASQNLKDYLRVTEINYNPPGSGDPTEFIELKNTSPTETLFLDGVMITEGPADPFAFSGSNVTQLDPGEFVLVVKNQTAFTAMYPLVDTNIIAGEFVGGLSNGGEQIKLLTPENEIIVDFEYQDGNDELVEADWHLETDGDGFTLNVINPTSSDDLNLGTSWESSAKLNGTPGEDNQTPLDADFNGDGEVGPTDLAILLANYGTASGAYRFTGDANHDKKVSLQDLLILKKTFGDAVISAPPPTAAAAALMITVNTTEEDLPSSIPISTQHTSVVDQILTGGFDEATGTERGPYELPIRQAKTQRTNDAVDQIYSANVSNTKLSARSRSRVRAHRGHKIEDVWYKTQSNGRSLNDQI